MTDIGYLNGQFAPLEEIKISPDDRGFLFGDGVYEVIRAYHGVPAFWGEHFARLVRSAREIQLAFSLEQTDFQRLLLSGLQRSGYQEGKIYIQVTRGVAPREHAFPSKGEPTVFLSFRKMVALPMEVSQGGVSVITCPDIRWDRCDIKSLNLLPNVLAKQKAREAKAFEAIFVREGWVSEGATSNIFAVKDGVIITPERNHFVLAGVTQQQVVTLARAKGMDVQFRPISISDLLQSEEVFLVGTTIEVLPVIQINGEPVRDGTPGPITTTLQKQFGAYVSDLTLS
ncbi:MAG: D-amino-acid transaminase [Nitrospirota bacterium]|nr:D-amino-acid transaminase [Nitrospirota bacterium]MDH5574528.1 D-amino-acid transaminase [Nitrospirota bacterium]